MHSVFGPLASNRWRPAQRRGASCGVAKATGRPNGEPWRLESGMAHGATASSRRTWALSWTLLPRPNLGKTIVDRLMRTILVWAVFPATSHYPLREQRRLAVGSEPAGLRDGRLPGQFRTTQSRSRPPYQGIGWGITTERLWVRATESIVTLVFGTRGSNS